MKALTIQQPYAHLIVTPAADLPDGTHPKRVENRTWATRYRGQLLIHAGQSLAWLTPESWPGTQRSKKRTDQFPDMTFGAVVGIAMLSDIFSLHEIEDAFEPRLKPGGSLEWLKDHPHTEGPFCWALSDVRRFRTPIAYCGKQGLFNIPDEVVDSEIRKSVALS